MSFTHNIGASYRMGILSVGLDLNMGAVKDFDCWGEDSDYGVIGDIDLCKMRTNHIRFFVGVKI